MDSLYQTVNGLVGNVDWGESLTVAACEVPGLNTVFSDLVYVQHDGKQLYVVLTCKLPMLFNTKQL